MPLTSKHIERKLLAGFQQAVETTKVTTSQLEPSAYTAGDIGQGNWTSGRAVMSSMHTYWQACTGYIGEDEDRLAPAPQEKYRILPKGTREKQSTFDSHDVSWLKESTAF
jgi:hypothetical protein